MDSVLITILCVYVLRFDWEKKKKKQRSDTEKHKHTKRQISRKGPVFLIVFKTSCDYQ